MTSETVSGDDRARDGGVDDRTRDGQVSDRPEPPGPSGLPFVGNTVGVVRKGLAFGDRVREYGDVVAYDALGERFVALFDPDDVETVLVSRSDEFRKGDYEMEFGALLAPDGLVFAEGDQWRRQRTALQPLFTPARVREYADAMVARTAAVADDFEDGDRIDLRETCSTLTLSILARTLFDVDLDGERGAVVRNAAAAIGNRMSTSAAMLLPEWAPRTPTERRFDRAMADFDALVDDLVAERRASRGEAPRANGGAVSRESTGDHGDRDDLLSTLLDAEFPDGTAMDESTVRDQLVTFLFAGHETTAVALTYAVWLLAGAPDVAARLRAEVETVCDGDPTFADCPTLEYTERVVKETLRLYPPAHLLYRQPKAETTLGGYRIPADATLQLSTYHVQRDPHWWDTPDEFRPDRWTRDTDRPEYAYFPFGGGPRHCIGMRFATFELQLALATLARRVAFERLTDEIDPSPKVTLDPGTVEMRVRRRD